MIGLLGTYKISRLARRISLGATVSTGITSSIQQDEDTVLRESLPQVIEDSVTQRVLQEFLDYNSSTQFTLKTSDRDVITLASTRTNETHYANPNDNWTENDWFCYDKFTTCQKIGSNKIQCITELPLNMLQKQLSNLSQQPKKKSEVVSTRQP